MSLDKCVGRNSQALNLDSEIKKGEQITKIIGMRGTSYICPFNPLFEAIKLLSEQHQVCAMWVSTTGDIT